MDEKNKPLFALTVGNFWIYRKKRSRKHRPAKQFLRHCRDSPRYVYGLKGIAALFGCGMVTASKIKRSGLIDRAVTQIGRKIIVDAPLALELVRQSKKGGRRR